MSFRYGLVELLRSNCKSSISPKSFLPLCCSTIIPHRTTYILKRRIEPKEYPRHVETERLILPDINQEYLVVEEADSKPGDPIKVVLTEIIEDVGKRGQIVDVDPIEGYMKYILTGKALYATPENIRKIEILSEKDLEKNSSVTAYKTMKLLGKKTLSVYMNMDTYWTIEPWHIRVMFRQNGVQILSDDLIKLPEKPITGPNLNLEGKDFAVTVTINNCEKVNVRCRLRHWTHIFSEKIVLPPNHECVPSEPIFEEQKEILDAIPLPVWVEDVKMA